MTDVEREIRAAVIAELAARSGVDVEAAVESIPQCMDGSHDAFGTRDCSECGTGIADALRLALAQQEARHTAVVDGMHTDASLVVDHYAEREAMWQALVEILSTPIGLRDYDELRRLRRALGLEGQ